MKIVVRKPAQEELKQLGIENWSSWNCPKSAFDWQYGQEETCYFHQGRVRVKTSEEIVEMGQGDLVTFPKGFKCTWEVLEPVRKVYIFK